MEILSGNLSAVEREKVSDRIRACILASACGNSLGGSSIGLTRKEILVSTGFSIAKDFLPGLSRSQKPTHRPGQLLSDSYLALAFAEAIIAGDGKLDKEKLRLELKSLLENEQFLQTTPGAVCLAGMRQVVDGLEQLPKELEIADIAVPFRAFIAGCLPGAPKTQEPLDIAREQCLPTHSDSRVLAASAVIADSVSFFVNGKRLDTEAEVREYVLRELDIANQIDKRFADSWDGIAPDLDYSKPPKDLPYSVINVQPDVNELVPTAVGIFLIYRHSLEEALGAAALAGGETDTVAAIVGALSGAYHGTAAIPERWLNQLEQKTKLESAASRLAQFWT